ncbi:nuclease-related domain-containing protein [Gordonia alkanivorans]|uniref:nuclease-related domain-containing protein n=1 Tax=Gordonia alkanivorans TaxID=84096 RepID=UPI0012DEF946|nr:nuclease-related domain-containing protein [Gordonia alkanivorans]
MSIPPGQPGQAPIDLQILAQRVFGNPGEGLVSDSALRSSMEDQALLKGLVGERKSHELFIAELARFKAAAGIQIVHGLRYPGTEHADIDHALVCGDRVFLIDSKLWMPDDYRWYGDAILAGPTDNPRLIRSGFGDAVTKFAALVAPAKVSAAILVHASRPGRLTVDNTLAGHHPPMRLAEDGLGDVISWLGAGIPRNGNDVHIQQYQQWQTLTMTRVLEQKAGTPQAHRLEQHRAILRAREEQRALQAQAREARQQAAKDLLANRKAKKQRRKAELAQSQRQFEQDRRQRRQDQVLRMQHDALNKERPGWKRKYW